MPRQAKPADLDLHGVDGRSAGASQGSSPINVDISTFGGDFGGSAQNETSSPKSVAKSPPTSPRLGRDSARTFFGGTRNKSTKEEPKSNAPYVGDEDENIRPGTSNISKIYHLKKNPGSTPELNLVGSGDSTSRLADEQGEWLTSLTMPLARLLCVCKIKGIFVYPFPKKANTLRPILVLLHLLLSRLFYHPCVI